VDKTLAVKKDFSAFGLPLCCKRKSKYDTNMVAPGDAEVEYNEENSCKKF